MAQTICVIISTAERERLQAIVEDRNRPQKHVWRAQIILATAEGCGTADIMRRAGVSKTVHLDCRPRAHHRRRNTRVPSVRFKPLVRFTQSTKMKRTELPAVELRPPSSTECSRLGGWCEQPAPQL